MNFITICQMYIFDLVCSQCHDIDANYGYTSIYRDNVDLLTVDRALGASAGAVAAVALLLPDHMSTTMLREKFFSVVKDAESRPFGAFNPK